MPNTIVSQVTIPVTQEETSSWININAIKKRWNDLMGEIPKPRRTEVSELLYRYYEDKSRIDEWSSWWFDLPIWRKGAIFSTIIGLAGLTGVVLGLAIPFVALATGILFLANKLIVHHEEHRRARGVRFVAEAEALTKQLDDMMGSFKLIAADMSKALEQVNIQATVMAKNNAGMTEKTEALGHEEKVLQEMIANVSAQACLMQKAQDDVTLAISGVVGKLQTVDSSIGHATVSIQGLDESINRFEKTTELMQQTEANLAVISKGLGDLLQQPSTPQPSPASQSKSGFNDAITRGQKTLALARERRAIREKIECATNTIGF